MFDYVIVGAGAAGCVLASRLTENPKTTVCLIEAGPRDWHPYIHIPAGFIKSIFNPVLTWQFGSEPTERTSGRSIPLPQGRVLGGSSSINGLVYNRGLPSDFDSWAAQDNPGWAFSEILPYFKRSEHWLGDTDGDYRGRNGPLKVTNIDWRHDICTAFIDNASALGLPRTVDYNGSSQEGVGYFQRFIHRGLRVSAARAFLRPARGRPNLRIVTNATVSQVEFDANKAVGVRHWVGSDRTNSQTVRAAKEVILSAGSINTARLLQISGIGDPDLLGRLGVPVVKPLTGVGKNLRDHYSVRLVAKVRNSVTINELARGHRLAGQIARWLVGQPSILALSPSLVHLFARSDPGLAEPDLQGVFTPASYKQGFVGLLDDYPGMTCGIWQQRPASTGFVAAVSRSLDDKPVIQPNYLSEERDRRVLLAGMRLVRKLLHGPGLQRYFASEAMPGVDTQSDDEMLDYAFRVGTSSWHLIGTAKMGPPSDPSSVVGADLRVYGIQSLRVVDASIMPSSPSANTFAATLMIAEKAAADIISG
jgi:choline dehydrogenase